MRRSDPKHKEYINQGTANYVLGKKLNKDPSLSEESTITKNFKSSEQQEEFLNTLSKISKEHCDWHNMILIVDDTDFNLMIVENQLKMLGFTCDKASNGINALDAIEDRLKNSKSCDFCRTYKIIFMDYEMPFMNGEQCALNIREQWPN